jgi:preprotein translocase subunit SecF
MSNFTKLFLGSTKIDFYKLSKTFLRIFLLEIAAFVIVITLVLTSVVSLNLSIDFTGGTLYEVDNVTSKNSTQIKAFIGTLDLKVTRYESINDGDMYRFRTNEGSIIQENNVLNDLSAFFNSPKDNIGFQRVGPTFGDDISTQGIRALGIFLLFISLLISYRYEFRFAVIALIALFHDLFMCVSIYILISIEITPATIIAILTVLGYSLYDTVVIFDKLKDASSKVKESKISITIMNTTFNEVIMRSINTSLTSIVPVLSLILVGNYLGLQGALGDFAIPLFIGMISGTYSSIFVTSPFISRLLTK